jgi:hypothetical protein
MAEEETGAVKRITEIRRELQPSTWNELASYLQHESARVRAKAALVCSHFRHQQCCTTLQSVAIADSDDMVACTATFSLKQLTPLEFAIHALLELVEIQQHAEIRLYCAVNSVGSFAEARSHLEVILRNPSWFVRLLACDMLDRRGPDPEIQKTLLSLDSELRHKQVDFIHDTERFVPSPIFRSALLAQRKLRSVMARINDE